MPHNIAYYISAHDFGHAARQQSIINELAKQGIQIHVRSAAPPKFFKNAVSHHPQAYDVGMKQYDALHFDVEASLQGMADYITNQASVIAEEVAFIREQNIELVVCDMPPIALEIATQANVPSVVITHFTWDWVYNHYTDEYPQYKAMVEAIRASYGKATLTLQMQYPIAHKFDMFPLVEQIPLLHNPTTQSCDDIRQLLNVPDGYKLCLVSMGGHTFTGLNIAALQKLDGWIFCVTPTLWEQVQGNPQYFRLIPQEIDDYQNLIAASDVLVGKAGGSTVSEVIAHRTPMIYTIQNNWREGALLNQTLQEVASAHYIPVEDFMAGQWVDVLDKFAAQEHHWADIRIDGAQVATAQIMEMIKTL